MCESFALFVRQPSGVPLLVLSYALLWFTVLSPHGVVLTAYLQTRDVSPPALAAIERESLPPSTCGEGEGGERPCG